MTKYLTVAREMLAVRRSREALFGPELFGEPAWDMLLELYMAADAPQPFMISNLGVSASVPSTTALRWIGVLLERGLIERRPDQMDGRRVLVFLTDEGRSLMDQLLGASRARCPSARAASTAMDMWAAATASPS